MKQEGGTVILDSLHALQKAYPQVALDEPQTYLDKRERMLAYPQFIAAACWEQLQMQASRA